MLAAGVSRAPSGCRLCFGRQLLSAGTVSSSLQRQVALRNAAGPALMCWGPVPLDVRACRCTHGRLSTQAVLQQPVCCLHK